MLFLVHCHAVHFAILVTDSMSERSFCGGHGTRSIQNVEQAEKALRSVSILAKVIFMLVEHKLFGVVALWCFCDVSYRSFYVCHFGSRVFGWEVSQF